jgi:hypothetical protein
MKSWIGLDDSATATATGNGGSLYTKPKKQVARQALVTATRRQSNLKAQVLARKASAKAKCAWKIQSRDA